MRRRGIASVLIGAAEDLARKNGVSTLYLHTPWGSVRRYLTGNLHLFVN